jgi:hypothetical protein
MSDLQQRAKRAASKTDMVRQRSLKRQRAQMAGLDRKIEPAERSDCHADWDSLTCGVLSRLAGVGAYLLADNLTAIERLDQPRIGHSPTF